MSLGGLHVVGTERHVSSLHLGSIQKHHVVISAIVDATHLGGGLTQTLYASAEALFGYARTFLCGLLRSCISVQLPPA